MMEASCWQEGEPMSIGDPLTATDIGGWGKKDAGTSNVNGTSKCRFTYPRLNHSNIHYRGIVVRFHLKKTQFGEILEVDLAVPKTQRIK